VGGRREGEGEGRGGRWKGMKGKRENGGGGKGGKKGEGEGRERGKTPKLVPPTFKSRATPLRGGSKGVRGCHPRDFFRATFKPMYFSRPTY
jgi:hypothetical protein